MQRLASGAGGLGGFAFLVGEEIGVGALEIVDVTVVEVPDASGNFVEKIVVVGDEEDGAFVFLQRDVECVDGFEIEVIARLVEDENVGLEQHEAAEKDARGFAAGERLDGLGGVVAAKKHLTEKASSMRPGALRTSELSSVVFPTPLRPRRPIFSLRSTLALKPLMTLRSP